MNCQEFAKIVDDLAEDQLMSALTRVAALAHAEVCYFCASLLASERALTDCLSAFADDTAVDQAPARLKQSLRATFEAQQVKVEAEPVVSAVIQMPVRRRHLNWALAAAAALIVVSAIAASVWLRGGSTEENNLATTATPTPTSSPVAPKLDPVETRELSPKLAYDNNVKKPDLPKRLAPIRRQQFNQASENETAGNYIPLNLTTPGGSHEDKLVVRVEVQRSTLIAMGLPLDAQRGQELVKADLMVGVDGIPLAIRLLRQ